ncbi:MAG: hypothetical protein ACXV2C_02875 [Candidatus Bathyarchaeia archaeon]
MNRSQNVSKENGSKRKDAIKLLLTGVIVATMAIVIGLIIVIHFGF